MRRRRLVCAVLAGLLGAGCLVQIDHVRDPGPEFEAARREAARLQGRKGPAKELNVLVYDASEQKLVRVRLPMWLARKIERRIDWDDDARDSRGDDRRGRRDDDDRVERAIRRHVNLREIEKAGLGLLVEVEDDEGEQVLVWLR